MSSREPRTRARGLRAEARNDRQRRATGLAAAVFTVLALACASNPPPAAHDSAVAAAEYAAASRFVDASREIEVALRRRPVDATLRLLAAEIHETLGAIQRAAEDLEIATASAPRDPATWSALAAFEQRRGRFDAAYIAARRAHRLAPEDPTLTNALADAAERAGLGDEARTLRGPREGVQAPARRSRETGP